MDTKTFLGRILPEQGCYIGVVFPKGMKGRPSQMVVDTTEQLSNLLLKADSKGISAYHACASYKDKKGAWDERRGKFRKRVVANTAFVRAQWLDIDVGPDKDYATRREALTALHCMCTALKLPAPMIVGSGKAGLHCYWCYASDIRSDEAAATAVAFSSALKSVGFKHDLSRTSDMASILRPVGTHNRKGAPVEVKVLRDAKAISYDKWAGMFASFSAPKTLAIAGVQSDWGSGSNNFAPSSAKLIVRKCKALYDVAKKKGDVDEPYWRAMIGLVKHTIEGDKLIHVWSKGGSGYSQQETDEKIASWEHGPTSCEQFSKHTDRCSSCPYKGKQTSPISLGYSQEKPPPQKEKAASERTRNTKFINQPVDHYAKLVPDKSTVPFWPAGYSWNGEQLMRFVKDKDGSGEWTPFSDTLYYPFLRYETEDKTRAMKVCALTDPQKNSWRIFDLDTEKASDPRPLAQSLAAQEVLYMPKAKERNMKFVQDVLHGIRDQGIETTTYNTFGWHGKGFVVGDKIMMRKGNQPVFLGSKVPDDVGGGFGKAGRASEWSELIDQIYNRPGAEPYQFVICAAMASILVKLCDTDMWHGIPIALTGAGGLGKTTTCKVACSVFGDPKKMTIQANDEGTTMNALIQRVSTMRNLPMVLDEITGRDTSDLQSMLFALSNGKPKLRLRPDGTEINPGQSWDLITFITGNLSITRMLADSDRVKADATQVRCFEIPLDDDFNSKVFSGINAKDLIEHKLLTNQYGEAGEEFIRHTIKNRAKITEELQKQRSSFAANDSTGSRERFYYDLIATTLVAAVIARNIGLIRFDLKRMRAWAIKHILVMRSLRTHSLDTPEDYMQAFLSYLTQHTVTTKYYRDGREKQGAENIIPPDREPLARHATEDRRFIVTNKAFSNWCSNQKTTPEWLKSNLEKQGYIRTDTDTSRMRLLKGTGMAGTQSRCIEFDYDKLDGRKIINQTHLSVVDDA